MDQEEEGAEGAEGQGGRGLGLAGGSGGWLVAGRQGPGAGWWVWRHGGMAAWRGMIGFELPGNAEMLRWLAFNDLRRRKQWIFPRKNRFFGLGVAQMLHWLAFSDLMRRKHTFFPLKNRFFLSFRPRSLLRRPAGGDFRYRWKT